MNSVDKDTLYQLYVVERKTMKVISEELGIATGKVHRLIHEFGIPARKISDYEATDKQRETWRAIGKASKGRVFTETHRKRLSESHKIQGRGHTKARTDGYRAIFYPDYPHTSKDGYVLEHVYVMEQHIGRLLNDDECVHHINFNRSDNRIENLQLMTRKEHMSYHMKMRWQEKKGSDDLSIV